MNKESISKKCLRKMYRWLIIVMGKNGLGLGKSLGSLPSIVKIRKAISRKIIPEFVMLRGNKIYLDEADALRLSYFEEDREVNEKVLYPQQVKKGDVVIDVGAFIGDTTLDFAKLVGKKGKVYAFEVNKENYDLLVKNVKANNYKNVVSFNNAVSDKAETKKYYLSPLSPTGHRLQNLDSFNELIDGWEKEEVKVITLDEAVKGKVDFLKIDVEGGEPAVIKGAERIISENKDLKIMLEVTFSTVKNFGITTKDYLERFTNLGYNIYVVKEFIEKKTKVEDLNKFIKENENNVLNLFLTKEVL